MEHMARDKKSVVVVFVEMVLMVCKMVADGTRVAFVIRTLLERVSGDTHGQTKTARTEK